MTARYEQVADDLRRLIEKGTLRVGSRLLPETRLAAQYRVSVPTLRDALEVLRSEGLVAKYQGHGNFVSSPPVRLTYPAGTKGLRTQVTSADTTATEHLAARLGTHPGALLTEYVCLTHRADSPSPHLIAHVYVPRTADSRTTASPWGDDLVTASGTQVPTSTDQATARLPTAAEAQSLHIGTRRPVLAIERTFTTAEGHVAGYAILVAPGDRVLVALTTPVQKAQP
jgi:GntR family transcriptional regulator